jgi:uncharacterized damage-inducible protein DinB
VAFSSDPFDILLGHNHWAINALLQACKPLSESDFHKRFNIGPGTLHDTLSHTIGAIFRWSDRIDGRTLRPSIEGRKPGDPSPMTHRTSDQLMQLNDEACRDFADVVRRARPALAEVREWKFGEETHRFTETNDGSLPGSDSF